MLAHDNVLAGVQSFHRSSPPMEHRIVSLLPLSHLLEQAVGLFYALDVGADILYVRSVNPRVIFEACCASTGSPRWSSSPRCSTCSGAPSSARSRSRAGRASSRGSSIARRPADGRGAACLPERPPAARRRVPAVHQRRRVPAARAPAGVGGHRRDRAPGLRRDRDGVRRVHDARGPRPRHGRAAGRASRCGSPTTARSSSAARPCSRATGTTPRRRPRPSPRTAGTRPATSATRRRRAARSCHGRKKDIIVLPNGFNVYPGGHRERAADRRHPRLGGRRDVPGRIEAVILPADPKEDPAAAQARDRCGGQGRERDPRPNQRVAAWRVWHGEDFPRTHTLKVKRDQVRKWAVVETALPVSERLGHAYAVGDDPFDLGLHVARQPLAGDGHALDLRGCRARTGSRR